MDDVQLERLKSEQPEQLLSVLTEFTSKYSDLFNFEKFHKNQQWIHIWRAAFTVLREKSCNKFYPICLNSVRILTRDEESLQANDIVDDLRYLLILARLDSSDSIEHVLTAQEDPINTLTAVEMEIIVEALKCLCNLVFQSHGCRRWCVLNNVTDGCLKRILTNNTQSIAIELYNLKLLFLLTALEPELRTRVLIDSNGIIYMTEWLDEKLSATEYTSEQLDLLCEMLKVMFNVTTSPDKSPNENEIQSLHLTSVLRELFIRFGNMCNDGERNVLTNGVHLLTNICSSSFAELIVKCDADTASSSKAFIFEGYNIRVIDILLNYLRTVLKEQENTAASNDVLAPILTVLVKCARCNATMRHYIRNAILPPLRDVSQRPEVGHELRNYLCRFLTLPVMLVRDLSAELLFVCCKENVGRMIKHTGYGNAAGLFANRGLLDCRRLENSEYSSDSEDSDTEEYKQLQHGINPVLGCYEAPKRNPLEGMSEEQKEYEAMQLVELMDKLHRSGVVQPCRIGEDGKPQPVDHILQLQEELPQQQLEQKRKT